MFSPVADAVILTDAPDVPGLAFRRFRGESDYPALTAVGNATREADGNEWVVTAEDVARMYAHLVNSDLSRDMLIAEIAGEMVGFVRGEWSQEENGLYRYSFSPAVVPHWRGRGIRRALLRWMEGRLREVAAEHPADAPKVFTTGAPAKAHSLIALLEEEGYQPVRYFHRMVRSLEEPLPDFAMPDGLEMRPVLPEHYRPIWDASNEAFRDHWGYSPEPEEYYQEWLEDPVVFTPELWQIAWDVDKNEIAGQVRTFIDATENEKFNRRRGYTEFISVRRPYRRRGLARALIAESLRAQRARGMTESALFVDAENVSGATRLYEECGFRTVDQSISFRKPL
jgi:GNAT superfamily N-acetyltransferase